MMGHHKLRQSGQLSLVPLRGQSFRIPGTSEGCNCGGYENFQRTIGL